MEEERAGGRVVTLATTLDGQVVCNEPEDELG
jgi:hypothetical protein